MAITSAIISVITSYDPGAGNSGDRRPYAIASLNDYRLYDFSTMGALSLFSAYSKFELSQPVVTQPAAWPNQDGYSTATYSIPLIPLPAQAKSGGGPYTYTGDDTRTAAYEYSSIADLLASLTVSFLAYSSEPIHTGETNGLDTASLNVYAAYIDVTFSDAPAARYWASGRTVLDGGTWASGGGAAPDSPTTVLDPDLSIDEDSSTYAEIQETNKIVGALGFSALWNPAKLVLDWVGAEPALKPRYNHSFCGIISTGRSINAGFSA